MNDPTPFIYRGFYDVPRMIIARYEGFRLLLDCRFDDDLDEYPDAYRVFVIPDISDAELAVPISWLGLDKKATAYLGTVAVKDIVFDETFRKEADISIVIPLLKAKKLLVGDE